MFLTGAGLNYGPAPGDCYYVVGKCQTYLDGSMLLQSLHVSALIVPYGAPSTDDGSNTTQRYSN